MNPALMALWAVIALLFALIFGGAAAALSWLDSRRVPRALLVGGSTAGATLALAVAVAALFI
ncbi:hypothetical protein [Dactylosporangium darangshiense]|uniref:Uncharacterized protein n=1 Tax=Dactylosporangium darangshiense TaxID=579108 RepID=A0ABP8DN07_9ACTN